MFIHAVPDNKGKKNGYFCSLVRSKINENGVSVHEQLLNFGFIPSDRLPYLRAAFNKGDPEVILHREMEKQQNRTKKMTKMMNDDPKTTKIRFTAEIETSEGTVKRVVELDRNDIPSLKDFDLSTKEGFLSDLDKLESAVLEGRNRIGEEIANAFLEESGKKNSMKNRKTAK